MNGWDPSIDELRVGKLHEDCRPDGPVRFVGWASVARTRGFKIESNGDIFYYEKFNSTDGPKMPVRLDGIAFVRHRGDPIQDLAPTVKVVAGERVPQFKVVRNMCFLSGAVKGTVDTAGTVLATLSEYCRPKGRTEFLTKGGNFSQTLSVSADGTVSFERSAVEASLRKVISLDGIFFEVSKITPKWETLQYWHRDPPPAKSLYFSSQLHLRQGFEPKEDYGVPSAKRFGKLCLLSGVLFSRENVTEHQQKRGFLRLPRHCRPQRKIVVTTAGLHGTTSNALISRSGVVRRFGGAQTEELVSLGGVIFSVAYNRNRKLLDLETGWENYGAFKRAVRLCWFCFCISKTGSLCWCFFCVAGRGFLKASFVKQDGMCVFSGRVMSSDKITDASPLMFKLPSDCIVHGGKLVFGLSQKASPFHLGVRSLPLIFPVLRVFLSVLRDVRMLFQCLIYCSQLNNPVHRRAVKCTSAVCFLAIPTLSLSMAWRITVSISVLVFLTYCILRNDTGYLLTLPTLSSFFCSNS